MHRTHTRHSPSSLALPIAAALIALTCLPSSSIAGSPFHRGLSPDRVGVEYEVPKQANLARSFARTSGFFITFEEGRGHDGELLGGFYAGRTFVNSAGEDWRFADSETGHYNAHSIDLDLEWNSGEYNHYGLVATWLGVLGDWGRIDFNNHDGTYFQLRYCTDAQLTLEAYDSADNLIDSQTGGANLRYTNGALDMGTLRVDAPPGAHIAWVRIQDSGNFWEIDNLEGDFSGVVTCSGADFQAWMPHWAQGHSCSTPEPLEAVELRPQLRSPKGPATPSRPIGPAAVPNPANSTVDPCLIACPAGEFMFHVIVRDELNNPVAGVPVTLHFEDCGMFPVCQVPAPYDVDETARTITVIADGLGLAVFPLRMGGTCPDQMVHVSARGEWLADRYMASPDQDGNLIIDLVDLAFLVDRDVTNDPRGDLNCDGVVDVSSCSATGVGETRFHVRSIRPNPLKAAGMVTLDVQLSAAGSLSLDLHDVVGRRWASQSMPSLQPGAHSLQWRVPGHCPPGIYFIRVSDGRGGQAKGMLIILRP